VLEDAPMIAARIALPLGEESCERLADLALGHLRANLKLASVASNTLGKRN